MWKLFRRFWRKILPVFILDLVCVLVRMGIYMSPRAYQTRTWNL